MRSRPMSYGSAKDAAAEITAALPSARVTFEMQVDDGTWTSDLPSS